LAALLAKLELPKAGLHDFLEMVPESWQAGIEGHEVAGAILKTWTGVTVRTVALLGALRSSAISPK